jgi:hypothetical protein
MTTDLTTKTITIIVGIIGAYFALTTNQQETLIAVGVAVATAVYAWYQNGQKNTFVDAMTPGSVAAATPSVIASLPDATWKMSDATKRNLIFDAAPNNLARILDQITKAEAANLTDYRINFNGGYYLIRYGLVYTEEGDPSNDNEEDGAYLWQHQYIHPRTGRAYETLKEAIATDGAIDAAEPKYKIDGSLIVQYYPVAKTTAPVVPTCPVKAQE